MSTFWYDVRATYDAAGATRHDAVRRLRDKVISEIGVDIGGAAPQAVTVKREGERCWTATTTITKRESVEL